jgi:hypothetical protein
MKFLNVLMLAGALTMTSTAFAQFANSGKSSGGSSADIAGYNRIGISYTNNLSSPNSIMQTDFDSWSLNGVSVDYLHGFSVSQSIPLFVEVGIGLNYGSGSLTDEYYYGTSYYDIDTTDFRNFNLQVPVNVAYHIPLAEDWTLAPYIGLNFKYGLSYKSKWSELENGDYSEEDWESLYDSGEDGDDETFKHFQIGWHIGTGVQFKQFYLGFQYGTDFTPIFKYNSAKINTSDFKVSLAYCF